MAKKKSFEESMKRLDEIVKTMSEANPSLDELVKLYEEGKKLSEECAAMLESFEGKIEGINLSVNSGLKND